MNTLKLGKYELLEELGRGGFGTVYRAHDTTLGREVAVKALHPQLMVDPGFIERFRNEARIIASLEHPNLVTVYDLGESGGYAFLVMRYLSGKSLRQRLEKGPIPFTEALGILKQTGAGLSAAHARGIIHRDIKPENILFTADGQAVVSDFGLAKAMLDTNSASSSTGAVGTPSYRAPELWRGKPPASPATDQYSLACVFVEMLTGQRLFAGDTPDEIITRHLIDGAVFPESWPADVPQGVQTVIARALAKDPKDRHPDLKEFIAALENQTAPEPGSAPENQTAPKPDPAPEPQPVPSPVGSWGSVWISRIPPWAGKPALMIAAALLAAALIWYYTLSTDWMPCVTASSSGQTQACAFNAFGQVRSLTQFKSAESGLPALTGGYGFFSSTMEGVTRLYTIVGGTVSAIPNTSQSWSPAALGKYLYFVSNRRGRPEIYFMDYVTAEAATPLTAQQFNYDRWSPAPSLPGGYVYFVSNKDGETEIYYMDLKGKTNPLTSLPGSKSNWSPAPAANGTVYFVSDRDEKTGIYTIFNKKGTVRITPAGEESWGPVPGLFGSLYYTSTVSGKAEIYKRNWLGQTTQVTHMLGSQEIWTGLRYGKSPVAKK